MQKAYNRQYEILPFKPVEGYTMTSRRESTKVNYNYNEFSDMILSADRIFIYDSSLGSFSRDYMAEATNDERMFIVSNKHPVLKKNLARLLYKDLKRAEMETVEREMSVSIIFYGRTIC